MTRKKNLTLTSSNNEIYGACYSVQYELIQQSADNWLAYEETVSIALDTNISLGIQRHFFFQFFLSIVIKMQYCISSKTVNFSAVGSIFLPVNTVINRRIRYMAGIFQFPSLGNQFATEGRGHSSPLQPVTTGVLLNSTFSPLLKFDTDLSYISQRTLYAISHQIH